MYVEFDVLPQNSRVWVYQAEREFTQSEVEFINDQTKIFIDQWTKHGDDLRGSFTIKYNRFLVLGVDENFNKVSGCSIDSSVRFVKQIENHLQTDLMNKMNLTFKLGSEIKLIKLPQFKTFVSENKIDKNTVVFNNLVNTKGDFLNHWEVAAKDSWHARFFN